MGRRGTIGDYSRDCQKGSVHAFPNPAASYNEKVLLYYGRGHGTTSRGNLLGALSLLEGRPRWGRIYFTMYTAGSTSGTALLSSGAIVAKLILWLFPFARAALSMASLGMNDLATLAARGRVSRETALRAHPSASYDIEIGYSPPASGSWDETVGFGVESSWFRSPGPALGS